MPTALVFSNLNIFTVKLVEKLLLASCEVYLVSEDANDYKKSLLAVSHNPNLKIFEDPRHLPMGANYVFSVNGFGYSPEKRIVDSEVEKNMGVPLDYAKQNDAKLIFISPFVVSNPYQQFVLQKLKALPTNSAKTFFVFLAELYGKNMSFYDGSIAAKIIKDASFRTVVNLPQTDCNIYYLYVDDAVDEVIKKTFSFGFDSNKIVLGQKDTAYDLFEKVQNFNSELTPLKYYKQDYVLANDLPVDRPSKLTPNSLKETVFWLSQYATEPQNDQLVEELLSKNKPVKEKILTTSEVQLAPAKKFLAISLITLVVVILLPFLSLFLSAISIKYALSQIDKGNIVQVERLLRVTTATAGFSSTGFSIMTNIPGVGGFYTYSKNLSELIEKSARVSVQAVSLSNDVTRLATFVLNDEPYDAKILTDEIYQKSQNVYREVALLSGEVAKLPASIGNQIPKEKLSRAVKYTGSSELVTKNLAELLGYTTPKTYLVLFQNNTELRPTGGFIGSFALVTFDKGKLTDINVMDVYEADGQLTGHVEPPLPLKNYLGEANWWLRDSNWSPDFPTSAKQAEWFLDKEIGRSVDGVIGIDLEIAKNLLEITGPVKLAEFNDEIDHKNMYEKVQYEVEEDFFPGSTKKASYLSALTKALLDRVRHDATTKSVGMAKVVLNGLESKHIQIYLHDKQSQLGISQAGWDGGLTKEKCSVQNCQTVLLSVNDANVGVNKANYFIERSFDLDTKITGGKVQNTLTVNYKNTATPALGLAGTYKGYVRLLTDKDSTMESIEIGELGNKKYVEVESDFSDYWAEYGTLLELKSGQEKTLTFIWNQDLVVNLQTPGSFVIQWEKQAGTLADPVRVKISPVGLTTKQPAEYNTNLAEDKNFPINW